MSPDPRRNIGRRVGQIILYDSIRPVRGLLSLVASLWAASLALPGDTLERPVYYYMRIVASEGVWVVAWTVLAGALWWRTLAAEGRAWLRFTVDLTSLLMFAMVAGTILVSKVWPFPAAVSGDFAWVIAALWVMVRYQSDAPGPGHE